MDTVALQPGEEALGVLNDYEQKSKDARAEHIQDEPSQRIREDWETRLQSTVDELRQHVANQRAELAKLRQESGSTLSLSPSSDTRSRLRQLRMIAASYKQASQATPTLPGVNSIIPSLLAYRDLQTTTTNIAEQSEAATSQHESTTQQLSQEKNRYTDSQLLSQTLATRIRKLQDEVDARTRISPEDRLRAQLRERQQQRQRIKADRENAQDALNKLIDHYLAPMLAVEELGGPVAGEGDLPAPESEDERDNRGGKQQRRLDDIWGHRASAQPGRKNNHSTATRQNGRDGRRAAEIDAAASEIHELLDQLSDALHGQGGSGAYVTLERDSPAARFLVRAKAAQFHPRDARRLRMIDFARDFDD